MKEKRTKHVRRQDSVNFDLIGVEPSINTPVSKGTKSKRFTKNDDSSVKPWNKMPGGAIRKNSTSPMSITALQIHNMSSNISIVKKNSVET
jgi:hypothetical protein